MTLRTNPVTHTWNNSQGTGTELSWKEPDGSRRVTIRASVPGYNQTLDYNQDGVIYPNGDRIFHLSGHRNQVHGQRTFESPDGRTVVKVEVGVFGDGRVTTTRLDERGRAVGTDVRDQQGLDLERFVPSFGA